MPGCLDPDAIRSEHFDDANGNLSQGLTAGVWAIFTVVAWFVTVPFYLVLRYVIWKPRITRLVQRRDRPPELMEFFIPCECGRQITGTEAAAGSIVAWYGAHSDGYKSLCHSVGPAFNTRYFGACSFDSTGRKP